MQINSPINATSHDDHWYKIDFYYFYTRIWSHLEKFNPISDSFKVNPYTKPCKLFLAKIELILNFENMFKEDYMLSWLMRKLQKLPFLIQCKPNLHYKWMHFQEDNAFVLFHNIPPLEYFVVNSYLLRHIKEWIECIKYKECGMKAIWVSFIMEHCFDKNFKNFSPRRQNVYLY